jgi:hypothetical protein
MLWWYGPHVPFFQPLSGYGPYMSPQIPSSKEQEIADLEDEERWLLRDLEDVRKRLEELRN